MWDAKIETMSRDELHSLQTKRLKQTVRRVYDHVPFYRAKMDMCGVRPEDIRDAEDIRLLPFTEKKDLRENYPFGLFAVERKKIIRIHASSGTTGKPTVTGYTRVDLDNWADLVARGLTCAGVTDEDTVHISYGYGLFTGGLGAHYGAERLGAAVIPVSGGNTQRQLMLLRDFAPTVLLCTPSYALNLADAMEKEGMTREDISLRIGVFGAEPWTDEMRAGLEDKLGIEARDIYGLTEMMGPGVAMECSEKNGLHIWEDQFIPEILDKDLQPLPDGQEGELVITTINKEAMPLIRYRTHDLSGLSTGLCPCGRTHRKLKRVHARTDDMLIIRGVNVFPSQIEHALLQVPGVTAQYQLIVDRKGSLDTLEVQVEMERGLISDTVRELEELQNRIRQQLASEVLVSCQVKLCAPGSLPRTDGKAKRIVDNRKI